MDDRHDDDLARLARGGDARALAVLYRRHASPLLGYLHRLLKERADAEDVLQETFLRLFQGRGRYRGRGRFRSWLFTVATRLALDRTRQRRRSDELAETLARSGGSGATVTPESLAPLLRRRIESVLADLPPSYAIAFHLRVREGFSYREIAAMSREAEGTLRSRVHHALKRVREALRGHAPVGPGPKRPREER